MGFFSSLRLPSRPMREPSVEGLQSHVNAMEQMATDGRDGRPQTSGKKSSMRWGNSFMHQKQNQRTSIIPQTGNGISSPFTPVPIPPQLSESKNDFIQLFRVIEQRFSEQFELEELEPANRDMRRKRDLETQKKLIKWQEPGTTFSSYPPCLKNIPIDERTGLLQIFNLERFLDVSAALLPEIMPGVSNILYGEPMANTMRGLEEKMRQLTRAKKNIGTEPSIANRDDWYTDAVFAQQSFTGPNPTSITHATREWMERFTKAAAVQGKANMVTLLKTAKPESMYIQDHSYFRDACNAGPDSTLMSDDMKRFGCAAVTLFQLSPEGVLHPLAIVLDYRVSMENSVCIFNQRLTHMDPTESEATDWPWRYAKMCHQVSDWTRHELQVHLNDCHFVMEATIVAAQRSFPSDHIVYQLLEPHWLKTLSLNAAARTTLIPEVITKINSFSTSQTHNFIHSSYRTFNWSESYLPSSLSSRGFSPTTLSQPAFHNYIWARNMLPMWRTLYKFIRTSLTPHYPTDLSVLHDKNIQCFYTEMQSTSGAQMTSFPRIQTVDDLANVLTMCIHIASPLHSSVNYNQCYYQSFIPNKPPCLMTPIPRILSSLLRFQESDLINALPINNTRIWLLSSQLPYLLSYGPAEENTLLSYAKELEIKAKDKMGDKWRAMEKAAGNFYMDLLALEEMFGGHGVQMDKGVGPKYDILNPGKLAVSILL